jgi:hypothetical protein
MSFINKSVNYSQTALLKTELLVPLLELYNNHLLNTKTDKTFSLNNTSNFIIPNNNKKYYLLITKKTTLEQTKETHNILYFFPDQTSVDVNKDNKLLYNSLSDFYLEINNSFSDSFLFEGYLYSSNNKHDFLITDILLKNKKVVSFDYNLNCDDTLQVIILVIIL